MPVRVDMTKKLMDTLRISIDKERQAFGITDAPTPTDDAIKGFTQRAEQKRIKHTNNIRFRR